MWNRLKKLLQSPVVIQRSCWIPLGGTSISRYSKVPGGFRQTVHPVQHQESCSQEAEVGVGVANGLHAIGICRISCPLIDDKSSLGRVNSTRVERKQLERSEEFDHMGFPDLPFSRLFAENKEAFVSYWCSEYDLKKDSYARQVRFLLTYAKAIARARNVPIQITVVNSLSGETALSLVEDARGQFVVTGNFLFLDRMQSRMDEKMTVAVTGTALHTETSLAFRVSWRGQDWWLKTERDMFFRAQFGETGSFPVMVEAQGLQNRPAMLVKDVGERKDLLFCCLEILNENSLPWSKAAESKDESSNSGKSTCLVAKSSGHLYEPLLAHLKWAGHPLITDNTLNLSLHTKVDILQPLICRKYQIQRLFRFSLQDDNGTFLIQKSGARAQ
ncbi:hypothetical protein SELMODRAFT_418710 [Selaginella moellendorffii]|uniref:Uncharacterized protein n=1 Tax=Selaginella moellendorffii TaxID=88036 RepID=D8S6X1_SELML|nr:hypothetical protein SELMODRAFT_418710 [Selaginella moellendorffii]